ncbi:hypothetical protein CAPTEDRAFT_212064 [Capitella teleta]|uniref:Uncharacterized protein n=1 Tax=Capitella teleta TaxID=283909 RepID=R7TY58_CAPTE|nr:hypothetical protein CAPTEDRAFT_212064 [Capitella teleta]|eukprot:ELT96356.1 hypothetical protein CAPTEDRAFT_212064 [Capitella teleta]
MAANGVLVAFSSNWWSVKTWQFVSFYDDIDTLQNKWKILQEFPSHVNDLSCALEHKASEDKVVFLTGLVDGGYVGLPVNLHIMSIAPRDICSILYIVNNETKLNLTQLYNNDPFKPGGNPVLNTWRHLYEAKPTNNSFV